MENKHIRMGLNSKPIRVICNVPQRGQNRGFGPSLRKK